MKYILEKSYLVDTGNLIGLMPINEDGWEYLAIQHLKRLGRVPRAGYTVKFNYIRHNYDDDGTELYSVEIE